MSSDVPDQPPSTREYDYASLVRRAWGDRWLEKEVVYQFGRRQFKSTDQDTSGIYTPPA